MQDNVKNVATVKESHNSRRQERKTIKGITLIALIITIIVLLIFAGVALNFIIGENGILKHAKVAEEKTNKQTATEKMNLKITTAQMNKYVEEQRMPTLQEFADELCEDNEIQYVQLQSKKVASLSKIEVGTANSIFTKLKEYPYEFEINSSLQLASIDGVKTSNSTNVSYDENIYDNWTTWLKLAGVEYPTTYNEKDILSDSSLMENVMNNEKAISYLAKSKYFLLPAVLNSTTAFTKLQGTTKFTTVPIINYDNTNIIYEGFCEDATYASYNAFDNDENTYTYTLKIGGEAIGYWIGYDFKEPVNVFKVSGKIRMYSYKIQYSDDLTTWNDVLEKSLPGSSYGDEFSEIITKNVGSHRYWRLYVNGGQQGSDWGAIVWSLQFYGIK